MSLSMTHLVASQTIHCFRFPTNVFCLFAQSPPATNSSAPATSLLRHSPGASSSFSSSSSNLGLGSECCTIAPAANRTPRRRMRVNISVRGAPDREGARPRRAVTAFSKPNGVFSISEATLSIGPSPLIPRHRLQRYLRCRNTPGMFSVAESFPPRPWPAATGYQDYLLRSPGYSPRL